VFYSVVWTHFCIYITHHNMQRNEKFLTKINFHSNMIFQTYFFKIYSNSNSALEILKIFLFRNHENCNIFFWKSIFNADFHSSWALNKVQMNLRWSSLVRPETKGPDVTTQKPIVSWKKVFKQSYNLINRIENFYQSVQNEPCWKTEVHRFFLW